MVDGHKPLSQGRAPLLGDKVVCILAQLLHQHGGVLHALHKVLGLHSALGKQRVGFAVVALSADTHMLVGEELFEVRGQRGGPHSLDDAVNVGLDKVEGFDDPQGVALGPLAAQQPGVKCEHTILLVEDEEVFGVVGEERALAHDEVEGVAVALRVLNPRGAYRGLLQIHSQKVLYVRLAAPLLPQRHHNVG
jgi:hypothetical protein